MSQPIENGGFAFPVPNDANMNGQEGMTLRDLFASAALGGMMARKESDKWTPDEVATDCYAYADAMIQARKGAE